MPTLKEKKELLASIREFRPLNQEELDSRRRELDDKVSDLTKKRVKSRIEQIESHRQNYNYKEFESQFTNAIKEYDVQKREEMKQREESRLQNLQKAKSYGQMVKSNFKPEVSKKKQLEMKLLKEKLKHNASKPIRRLSAAKDPETEPDKRSKKKKIVWKDNPMRPKTPPKKEVKVIDYLKEYQEKLHANDEENPDNADKYTLQKTWKKDLKEDLNQQERYELIKDKAKMLEETALRKEKYLQVTNGGTMKDTDQVNDMIFESIRAKLSILEEINS